MPRRRDVRPRSPTLFDALCLETARRSTASLTWTHLHQRDRSRGGARPAPLLDNLSRQLESDRGRGEWGAWWNDDSGWRTGWVDWSTHRGAIIHRGAAATEHSHSRTPQSSDVLAARRIAADGTAYTYTDFVNWYGTCAGELWERAAATEHSKISSIATDALPALQPQAAATMRCSTQADLVQMHDVGLLGTERGRDATEHSPLENAMETQASSSGSNEPRAAVKTIRVGDLPRDATEHSPMENTDIDDGCCRWWS
jgi:hypothetical protein